MQWYIYYVGMEDVGKVLEPLVALSWDTLSLIARSCHSWAWTGWRRMMAWSMQLAGATCPRMPGWDWPTGQRAASKRPPPSTSCEAPWHLSKDRVLHQNSAQLLLGPVYTERSQPVHTRIRASMHIPHSFHVSFVHLSLELTPWRHTLPVKSFCAHCDFLHLHITHLTFTKSTLSIVC